MRHFILPLVVCASTPALASGPSPTPFPLPPHGELDSCGDLIDVDAITQKYLEIVNSGTTDWYGDIFAPDYVWHSPGGTTPDLATFKGMMGGVYDAFDGITYTMDDVLVDGNRIIYRYSWTGYNDAPFLGLGPVYRTVIGTGIEIDTIEDGYITETWNYADMFGLMQQLQP